MTSTASGRPRGSDTGARRPEADDEDQSRPGWWAAALRRAQLPAWSALSAAAQMGVALLSARWLGPSDRGQLVVATTVATLLLLVSSLGAGPASRVILAAAHGWWTWPRYLALAAALLTPHLVICATAGLLLVTYLSPATVPVQIAFLAFALSALLAHLLREGLHGLGRHRTTIAIDVGVAVAQLAALAAVHAAGRLTAATALTIAAGCLLAGVVVQALVGRQADLAARERTRTSARQWWSHALELIRFSRIGLLAALGQSFVISADRLIIGWAGSASQVGIYSVAATLAGLAWVLMTGLTAVLTRQTAASGSLAPWRRWRSQFLAAAIALAVCVAVAGHVAVPLLLGDAFLPARSVLPILCLAAIPYASYQLDAAACAGLRDLRTGAVAAVAGSFALVGTAMAGYHLDGLTGVALGVLAVYVLMAVIARVRILRLEKRAKLP
jgi:O-antigen/teichoic acid export membrane protein